MRFIVWAALIALCPAPAAAFCGFFVSGADSKLYNNASQVVLTNDKASKKNSRRMELL